MDVFVLSWSNPSGKAETKVLMIQIFKVSLHMIAAGECNKTTA